VIESAEGLCGYFDIMLPSQLLYKFEKPQYDELVRGQAGGGGGGGGEEKELVPSEQYGFPHLLRLFVRLGYMMASTGLDERSTTLVIQHAGDMLKFLKKIRPERLSDAYETAPPDYTRLAYS